MQPSGLTRLQFKAVPVTETSWPLANLSRARDQPEVVKLVHYRPLAPANESCAPSPSSAARCEPQRPPCCLIQIERPEFRSRRRRRRAEEQPNPHECLAGCAGRRAIDIELVSLAGQRATGMKLVILALTRVNEAELSGQLNPLRCSTQASWLFAKFEPSHLSSEANSKSTAELRGSLYSRMPTSLAQQAALLQIESLELGWKPLERRESLTLTIATMVPPVDSPNPSSSSAPAASATAYDGHYAKQETFKPAKETLIVTELSCTPKMAATGQLPAYVNDKPAEVLKSARLHLLTLIRREPSQSLSQLAPASSSLGKTSPIEPAPSSSSSATATPSHKNDNFDQKHLASLANDQGSHMSSSPGFTAHLLPPGLPGGPGADISYSGQLATTELAKTSQAPLEGSWPSRADSQLIKSMIISPHRPALGSVLSEPRMRWWSELEAIQVQLMKPGSFIFLTIFSAFIIFLYSLCLLACFRCRKERSRAESSSRDKQLLAASQLAHNNQDNDDNYADDNYLHRKHHYTDHHERLEGQQKQSHSPSCTISRPFNLQMPPATRTRLEMMLAKKTGNDKHKDLLGDTLLVTNRLSRQAGQDNALSRPSEKDLNHRESHQDTNHDQLHPKLQQGSLNHSAYRQTEIASNSLLHSLRRVATQAKSRLARPSYHRSGLNAIPEVEAVQQLRIEKTSPEERLTYQLDTSDYNSTEQIDILVRDALSPKCSHSIETYHRQQFTSTLFAKPIETSNSSLNPVSRSRIVNQTKVVKSETDNSTIHHNKAILPSANLSRD